MEQCCVVGSDLSLFGMVAAEEDGCPPTDVHIREWVD